MSRSPPPVPIVLTDPYVRIVARGNSDLQTFVNRSTLLPFVEA